MAAAGLITPILWDKKLLGENANLVYLNPFTSFVESMRDPLLGYEINYNVYIYLIIFLIFGNIVTYFFYQKKEKFYRIGFKIKMSPIIQINNLNLSYQFMEIASLVSEKRL